LQQLGILLAVHEVFLVAHAHGAADFVKGALDRVDIARALSDARHLAIDTVHVMGASVVQVIYCRIDGGRVCAHGFE